MSEYKRLDELCYVNMGQSPSSKSYNDCNEGIPFFQGNADFGKLYPTVRLWCNEPTKIVEPGTLLISVRAPIGALNFSTERSCIGRGLAGIVPKDGIDSKYIYYFLKSKKDELERSGTGSTFKAISKGTLAAVKIKIIPEDEQHKVVQVLDKICDIIDSRKQQIEELDTLVKARFVEMFGDPAINTLGLPKVRLKECLTGIENGKSFVCAATPRQGDKPAILKLSAATYGEYNPKENKALLDDEMFDEEAEVHAGDLLFTRKNTPELVGICAYVSDTSPKLMMPDLIFRLNTNERCNKIFLWKLINHDLFRHKISQIATGSAKSMSNISKERLGNLEIALPNIEKQNEFALFVSQIDKSKFHEFLKCGETLFNILLDGGIDNDIRAN